jgi:proline-specific peptidase
MENFYRRHVCRLQEWPDCLNRTVANLDGNQVYMTMNGPNEFTVIGNLKGWDRTERLHEISEPVLITVGRYDEITPACAETMHARLPKSWLVVQRLVQTCLGRSAWASTYIDAPVRVCH